MALKTDILNYVGVTDGVFFDELDEYALFTEGLWKAAQSLPKGLLLQNASALSDPENITANTSGNNGNAPTDIYTDAVQATLTTQDILLLIERVVSKVEMFSNQVSKEKYESRFVDNVKISEKHRVLDSNSIYLATDYSPVYWIENDSTNAGRIKIFTAPSTVATYVHVGLQPYLENGKSALRIYKYSKETIDASTTTLANIPITAHTYCYKIMALQLINAWLGKNATENDDAESFALIAQQKQLLESEIGQELKNFREMY